MDTFRLLSVSVTPVVLISACGLMTLALYNRLSAILARIRVFHRYKVELLASADGRESGGQTTLLEMTDSQIAGVTRKAKAVQRSLYCLLSAALAFLACSLLSAGAALYEWVGVVALGMHVLGLALFAAGIGWAIRELAVSLSPLEEEGAYLEVLAARHTPRSQDGLENKAAKAA